MADDKDPELTEIVDADLITMADRMRSKLHKKVDRADDGRVTYPRREYLQSQASMRRAEIEAAKRRAAGK